jgi:hypothetical protein
MIWSRVGDGREVQVRTGEKNRLNSNKRRRESAVEITDGGGVNTVHNSTHISKIIFL